MSTTDLKQISENIQYFLEQFKTAKMNLKIAKNAKGRKQAETDINSAMSWALHWAESSKESWSLMYEGFEGEGRQAVKEDWKKSNHFEEMAKEHIQKIKSKLGL